MQMSNENLTALPSLSFSDVVLNKDPLVLLLTCSSAELWSLKLNDSAIFFIVLYCLWFLSANSKKELISYL